jgi:hypothetical protein
MIDVGRTLFVRRRPEVGTVAVILLLRPGGCDVFTLAVRARPLALGACGVDTVDGARLWPLSVAASRAVDGVIDVPFGGSGLAAGALLCIDCVRVCERVDGALPS